MNQIHEFAPDDHIQTKFLIIRYMNLNNRRIIQVSTALIILKNKNSFSAVTFLSASPNQDSFPGLEQVRIENHPRLVARIN